MNRTRRAFLASAAATIALPWLPSLLGRAAANASPPRRVVLWYAPNGFHMPAWTPAATGANVPLPTILSPLTGIQDEVLVLTGLENRNAEADVPGDHARGTGSYLTCAPVVRGEAIHNGVSIDQRIAAEHGGATLFPSLELGLSGGDGAGDCDSGYSCAYARNIAWSGPETPLAKLTSPQLVFDRLFAGVDGAATAADRERRRLTRASVLDTVHRDAATLASRLATEDATRLDEFLTGVRALETRVHAEGLGTCTPPERPGPGLDLDAHARAMAELMVTAIACDLTRVCTFMLGNAGSNQTFEFLGVQGAHHDLSHHQDDPSRHAALTEIGRWEVSIFAAFLDGLARVTEADGRSALDHTVAMLSSEIGDGNAHTHRNLPVVVAGGAAGGWRPGRHLDLGPRPIADLYASMRTFMGSPAEAFGDGSGPISELA